MENQIDALQNKLWRKSTSENSPQRDYWNNISFSLTAINHSVNGFLNNENPLIAVCYAKILIMELWSIREFLKALNINISEFDDSFPNIKRLRDSYAHIDERINGTKKNLKSLT